MSTPGDRLELLETFVRIAETGDVGAAAGALETTQSNIGHRLRRLEELLGATLVQGGPDGLALTPDGAALLSEARRVLNGWRGLEHAASGADAVTPRGLVRVSADRAIGTSLLGPIFAAFLSRHPQARLELTYGEGPIDLSAEDVDFAIRVGRPVGAGAIVQEVAETRDVLCAAPDLARRLSVERGVAIARCEPLALEGAPLIARAPLSRTVLRFFGRSDETEDVRFTRVAAAEEIDAALDMARTGIGLALLPEWAIREDVADETLIRIATEWRADPAPVTLSWTPARTPSPAAAALRETARRALLIQLDPDAAAREAAARRRSAVTAEDGAGAETADARFEARDEGDLEEVAEAASPPADQTEVETDAAEAAASTPREAEASEPAEQAVVAAEANDDETSAERAADAADPASEVPTPPAQDAPPEPRRADASESAEGPHRLREQTELGASDPASPDRGPKPPRRRGNAAA